MKVTEIWKSCSKPSLSFELFPARSPNSSESLEKAIDALVDLKPNFVSVTFGAGGSTREGSRQLLDLLKRKKGQEVIGYFAGYGLSPIEIKSVLTSYKEIDIENILVVRGDPPHDEAFKPHPQSFPFASDLVDFIKPQYSFSMGVAGYPEGHINASSKEKDMEYLKLKVDRGADYIISNYFYDNKFFFDFVERCRGIGIKTPIVPGVMPVFSVKMMEKLANTCGATITEELRRGISSIPEGDKQAILSFGIDFAFRQCKELLKAGVPGLHIYTMDRSESTTGIVKRLRSENLL